MTTAAQLLTNLQALGVTLQAHGDKLRFFPRAAVSGDLLARLQAHKPELLRLLAGGAEPVTVPTGDVAPVAVVPLVVDDLQPQDDSDAADWSECTTPDGRHGWQWCDVADDGTLDLQPCKVCGGLERWQDLAGGWHCEACSPRTAGPRLLERAAELRQRYAGRARA